MTRWTLALIPFLAACAAGPGGGGDGGNPGGSMCTMRNDQYGPGQYADSCVQADWVTPYVGSYSSAKCDLTISMPAGAAPLFEITVKSGAVAGSYSLSYEGGTGRGNDSYYRTTSDATYATTVRINFGVGKVVDANEEHGLTFTIANLDATPTFTSTFTKTITTPQSSQFEECGMMTKAP